MAVRGGALLGTGIAVAVYLGVFLLFSAPGYIYALTPLYALPHSIASGWLVPRFPEPGVLLSVLVHGAVTVVLMPLLLVAFALALQAPEMVWVGWGVYGSPITVLGLLIGALTGLRYVRRPRGGAVSTDRSTLLLVAGAALLTVLGLQAFTWAPEDLFLTRCSSSCWAFLRTPLSWLASIALATESLVAA